MTLKWHHRYDYNLFVSFLNFQLNGSVPAAQSYKFFLPKNPEVSGPYALGEGPIGFAKNGVPFFNPLTSEGLNAVGGASRQAVDACMGASSEHGEYHYRQLPKSHDCDNPIYDIRNHSSQFLGVALDGFPIYRWAITTWTS